MDLTARSYPFERTRPFEMPEEFAWARANEPVARITLDSGDPALLVTRYEDVRAALPDPRLSRNLHQAGAARMNTGFDADESSPVFTSGASISMGPGHTRWRRMVNRAFTQRQADAMRAGIAAHADEVVDALEARGGGFDLMSEFAYKLPIRVIADLLGVPADTRPEFVDLAAKLTRLDLQSGYAAFGEAMGGIGRYTAGLIVRKRKDLGEDLLSTLIGLHDEDDSQLSNEELVATVMLLLMAGYESTAVQFGNAFYALFLNPDQADRLRAEPELVETGVEEVLRYAQMGTRGVGKFATEDIELPGGVLPAGSTVFLSLGSANRDERVFGEDSARFDVSRASASRHLAFSGGPHFCLGAALARAEMQEGIGRLLARFPKLRLDGDLQRVELTSNLFTFYPRELPVLP